MTPGEKISRLRKENNMTQEQLAAFLGVSRQAVSKWEIGAAYPETDKLIRISELFDCSLDYLLKDSAERENGREQAPPDGLSFRLGIKLRERKSETMIWGMPLWHIGKNARGFLAIGFKARGVIAIGLFARGVLSLGLLSLGIFAVGLLALGLLAFGTFALGGLAVGSVAVGLIAAGAICFGVISLGAIAIGEFSAGALAIGKYFAIGDHAQGMIAVGQTRAVGSIYQKIGDLTPADVAAVKELLDANTPVYLAWAKELIKLFLVS